MKFNKNNGGYIYMNIVTCIGILISILVASCATIMFVFIPAFEKVYTMFINGQYQYEILLLLLFIIGGLCIIIGQVYEILKPDDDHEKYIPFDL